LGSHLLLPNTGPCCGSKSRPHAPHMMQLMQLTLCRMMELVLLTLCLMMALELRRIALCLSSCTRCRLRASGYKFSKVKSSKGFL
jgi:hypothetical protein